MARETPFHLERIFLIDGRHVVDLSVTGRTSDSLCDVDTVIEIDERARSGRNQARAGAHFQVVPAGVGNARVRGKSSNDAGVQAEEQGQGEGRARGRGRRVTQLMPKAGNAQP